MLARTPLDRAPRPVLGTAPIPKERYVSAEFARLERERLWPRVWLLAGVERDLPAPGDYLTYEIADESILVVRQTDGTLRAHHNVCMHRGNRLREPGRGHARLFVCQYHGWRYGLDGALVQALDPHTFPQGCPRTALDLRPVRCETWAGFVFVNLDPEAAPLGDYLGVLPAHLDPYHFEEMTVVDDWTIEIPCNWKTSLDAFNEAYHIAATHSDTLPFNDDVDVPIDCYERHSRMILKLGVQSPRLRPTGAVNGEIQQHFLARYGIDPATFHGGPSDVRPAIAAAVRRTVAPALGADVSELHDAQLSDDFHYTLFPNVTLNVFGVSAWVFRHRPHPDDPNRMLFDFWDLLRAPGQAVPRAAHRRVVLTDDLTLDLASGGGKLLGQDLYNLPRIQAGMRSRGYAGLHLGDQEIRIRHFHHVLDGYLGHTSRP
jgi:phenylpropionate dioxygenase-like ring-hydroxylating dioxygenase large terminal subunit